jgi:solute carrier family 30 (zinc transporter), member 1
MIICLTNCLSVRSAGSILLQGVPSSISLSNVRGDIRNVSGVESVHELHVWQLSETRFIASVHIKVSSTRPYMDIVRDVKQVLHQNGIHSGTVQPEFADDNSDTKVCDLSSGLYRG